MTLEQELLAAQNADAWYHKGVRCAKIQTEGGQATISARQLAKLKGKATLEIPPDKLVTMTVRKLHRVMVKNGWDLTSVSS